MFCATAMLNSDLRHILQRRDIGLRCVQQMASATSATVFLSMVAGNDAQKDGSIGTVVNHFIY